MARPNKPDVSEEIYIDAATVGPPKDFNLDMTKVSKSDNVGGLVRGRS